MATKVVMEALSPTMEEGRLVKWLKNEGDAVVSGDVLAEVETDKAVMELVARGDGVLRKRLIADGETRPVGQIVGVIAGKDDNIDAILAEADRFEASLIVLGWRGHGVFRRLLAGSVSRSVAERAQCPVLIVRTAARTIHRFVVGFDGCPNAERALDLLSSLEPGRGSRVVLVNVVASICST